MPRRGLMQGSMGGMATNIEKSGMKKAASRAVGSRRRQNRRRRSTGARSSPGRKGLVAFAGIALAVIAAAAYFLWPAVKPVGPAAAGEVIVELSMDGFNPFRIEAVAGRPVTLRLVNQDSQFHTDGGGWHQFAVDELGVDVKVPPLKTQEFTFTPTQSGTFEFYCEVCCGGRENPAMLGTLAVRS